MEVHPPHLHPRLLRDSQLDRHLRGDIDMPQPAIPPGLIRRRAGRETVPSLPALTAYKGL